MEYDADLYKAEPSFGGSWTGFIYGDKKGRFTNGTHVFTSKVKEKVSDGYYEYLITRNSVYRLIKETKNG